MRGRFAYLDAPHPLAFAHRGGAAAGDENTWAAFARSVDLGYRYLETDVRATADGVLLAIHDSTLERVTDATGVVERLRWADVRRARVGGAEPVPRLEDALAAWPEARFNVDVKAWTAVAPLVAAIRRTASIDRVCVASFNDRRTAAVRAVLGPRLCTSYGTLAATRLRIGSALPAVPPRVAAAALPCAQVPVRAGPLPVVGRRLLAAAHRRGVEVHAWTVDDPAQMRRLLDLGVDGLMTDRPEVLKEVLLARGQWTGN